MTAVRISKHSLFRLKITVGCRLCAYPSIHVEAPKITVGSRLCCVACGVRVCCERVCTLGVVACVYEHVALCVLVVVWCCFVWCGVVRFGMQKTHPCVDSKRLRVCRVYPENARMCCTCTRFPGTHGGVLNADTEAF